MDFYKKFIVNPDKKADVREIDTSRTFGWDDREKIAARLAGNVRIMQELQYKIYAENRQSLLIVLQAMDAGGKDGTINNVLWTLNPQGCRCRSFKVPSTLEASHDFLWRIHKEVPGRGEVVIFNRSHYESVLVERVHEMCPRKILEKRYRAINSFEKVLASNGTAIVKFFLHISREEQLKRFGERLDDPRKHWKISESDYKEREYWDDYMAAFNDALNRCSTKYAPWFIIPADNKLFRNLAVSEILVKTMRKMDPQMPEAHIDAAEIRRLYHRAANGNPA
ncbi:MAG: Polyphosphate kinase 2 (PPK2) [Lentisphaerae bacterium ADurb.Bin242]|nr:MAG: Polyphosphate kinase 2 (PPK2) [Lentisphaerae bacterium ADurb.Bin242]